MILETLVKIDGRVVGHIPAHGPRYLDRAAFLRLRPTARLRAYLGLVAPAARRVRVLARVCGVPKADVGNFLLADLQHGRVRRHPHRRGYWMDPNAIPTAQSSKQPAGRLQREEVNHAHPLH